ncbi:hypothetical protein DFA_08406 [Cavenderia fasciculata]|uniref:Uncharacterized protein n=1 Tax=Cavenderia fasciculata TaxID=261658 RepID=F4Q602_CACFS|nr:uncharacterized protein DFA_08406 [Cavenderia fasciculata]EGG17411.1 hypothetical protein DFA_08406 [Cavenderia fasciculata]|eukprot:XP_004355895.1 hypothetical protein DFA_08406 [Cavenderia fasciculata]
MSLGRSDYLISTDLHDDQKWLDHSSKVNGLSINKLLSPIDYSPVKEWILTRNKSVDIGLGDNDDNDDNDYYTQTLSSISISNNLEYIVSCSNNVARFYRILMYPNHYPSWTHLYYGSLDLNLGNNNSNVIDCILTDNHKELLVLMESPTFYQLDIYQHIKLETNNKNVSNHSRFNIVFPEDNYNDIWMNQDLPNSVLTRYSTIHLEKKNSNSNINPTLIMTRDQSIILSIDNNIYFQQINNNKVWEKKEFNSNIIGIVNIGHQSILICQPDRITLFNHRLEMVKEVLISESFDTRFIHLSTNQHYQSYSTNQCNHPIIVTVMNNHLYITIISFEKNQIDFNILQLINPPSNQHDNSKRATMKLSIDSKLLIIIYPTINNNDIYCFNFTNNLYQNHSIIKLNQTIQTIEIFNLKYYYFVASVNNDRLLFFRESLMTAPECDSMTRISSYYLPPPPTQEETIGLERYGLILLPWWWIVLSISIVICLYLMTPRIFQLERFVISHIPIPSHRRHLIQEIIFYISVLVILMLSIYEIKYQPTYVNDWPAHIHHLKQFNDNGKGYNFDYNQFMHYHGPCTYPSGFIYLYSFFNYLTNQSLSRYQIVWTVMETINFLVIKRLCTRLQLPTILAFLPVLSNRLHLYNVRVVINDFPSTLLLHIGLLALISNSKNGKYKLFIFCTIYSCVVSLKLHTVFFAPALLVLLLEQYSLVKTSLFIIWMGFIQLLIGLPFLLTNWVGYLTLAYDFSRTLLWEKTRNFKFVGRIIYQSNYFNLFLLSILIFSILFFFLKNSRNNNINTNNNRSRIFKLLFTNFIAIIFARGLYSPFLCWYFYTLPIITHMIGMPYLYTILLFIIHETTFRFFPSLVLEIFCTWIYFISNLFILFFFFYFQNQNNLASKIKNN